MIVLLLRILRSQLVQGSALTLGSSIGLNVLNYLYTLAMGRILGHGPFGVLSAAFALFWLLVSAPTAAISLTVTKWSASHERPEQLAGLGWELYHKLLFILVGVLTVLTVLHLAMGIPTFQTLLFVSVSTVFYCFLAVNTGILSGLRAFSWLGALALLMGVVKLTLALWLVFFLGWGVPGALVAIAISIIVSWSASFWPLRQFLRIKRPFSPIDWGPLLSYLGPVFVVTLAATAFMTLDILAVKWFLPLEDVGLYAAVMSIARLIFFTASPVAAVLFPLVVARRQSATRYQHLFFFALVTTLGACALFLIGFSSVPNLIATLLYGVKYPHAAQYLLFAGGIVSMYTLVWLFMTYLLSLHHTRFIFWPFLAIMGQALLLALFHQNLVQVLQMTGLVLAALLVILGYYVARSFQKGSVV